MDDVQQLERIHVRADEDFLDLGEPFVHLAVILPDVSVLLVGPVCGDSLLGDIVHPLAPDLHLDP